MGLSNETPKFRQPPVSEIAISVSFAPLENWSVNQALSFAMILRSEYPNVESQPTLLPEEEKFGDEFWQHTQPRVEIISDAASRVWYLEEPSNWLIQVQNDRFVVNWRKITGDEAYPGYDMACRLKFIKEMDRFFKFVADQSLGQVKVTQCEVTYVNDILREKDWNSVQEAIGLFTILAENKNKKFLCDMETIAASGSYLMPDQKGRLRFWINHALRSSDKRELIKMTLTARGRPSSSERQSILDWIDMGREWVVKGFDDMTTEKAHQLWGKEL